MGNSWACFTPKGVTFTKKPSKRLVNSSSTRRTRKKNEKLEFDDALIHQQALAAAFLFHQHQQNGSLPLNLNRSTSVVYPSTAAPKKLPKSSSSRQRSRSDHSLIQPLQLVNKQMGNSWACFTPKGVTFTKKPSKRLPNSSSTKRTKKKDEELEFDDALIHQQALSAAFLFHQHQLNGSVPVNLNRSTSVVYPSTAAPKKLPKSSSSRQRSRTDHSLIQPLQLVNKDLNIDGLETIRFVLVHGGGFGAWCWYKTITLLEESGYRVDAVDLAGSGIHTFDTNSITSLAQYVKPLTDILEKLGDGEKVILVGHDFGGACISYVMELFPSKISKAIFIAAAMLSSGQSFLDMFSQQTTSNDLMQQAQKFLYTNGKDQPPTAIDLDKELVKDFLFNQSPAKDVALSLVSMRPIPFGPVMEKLSLSDAHYGSIRRFYIGTPEDCAIPVALQENIINTNPPEQVFWLKGSDHAPFFSRPQSLNKILVKISQIPPKQA